MTVSPFRPARRGNCPFAALEVGPQRPFRAVQRGRRLRARSVGTSASALLAAWLMLFAVQAQGAGGEQGFDAFKAFSLEDKTVADILTGPARQPHADTYYLIAMTQARRGENVVALGTIDRGLKIEPRHLGLLNLRAAIYARTGRGKDAIAAFRKVLEIAPDDTYARESLRLLVPPVPKTAQPRPLGPPKVGTSPDAPVAPVPGGSPAPAKTAGASGTADAGEAAPAKEEKVLAASYFIGIKAKQRCFQGQSALKRAQEAYVKGKPDAKGKLSLEELVAAKLLPAAPVCPDGGAYTWQGDGPACSKHGPFGTLEAEVNTVFADFNRAMSAKFTRNFPEALKSFQQVIVMYPRWSEAHFQMGDTLFRLGDDRKAIEETRACLALEPDHLDAKLLLANLLFKVGHKDSALELLDGVAKSQTGTVYGLSARSIAAAIRSGRNYYQIFPPH